MDDLGSLEHVDALTLIRQLNETDEHSRCEGKTSQQLGRSLMETVCAYANEPGLGGGFVLLGVAKTDDSLWPTFEFVGIDDPDQLQADVATQCAGAFNRPIRPQMRVEVARGQTTVVMFVPELSESEKPLYFRNDGLPRGAYRRIGSTDQRCSEDDLLVFYGNQQIETFDRQVIADATLDDIDVNAVGIYRAIREGVKPDAEELQWSQQDLLLALSCVKRVDAELKPTVAGILLFGTQHALRRCFPMMRIDYIRVQGQRWVEDVNKRFDSIEIREPLIRAISRARATVLDDLPKAFSLPSGRVQREDVPALPDRVVREVIVNAVMHRCYRTHGPVSIIRYSNRIEIRNPGHSLVSEERLGQPGSETRNPAIAAVLYDVGLAETKGSGIRAMRKLMNEAMLLPPVFESDREGNRFVAYLLLHHFLTEEDIRWLGNFKQFDLTDDEQRALIFAREMGAVDNSTYRNLNGVDTLTASGHLRRLRDFHLLEMRGKGARTYYKPTEYLLNPSPPTAQSGELEAQSGGLEAQSGGDEYGDFAEHPSEIKENVDALSKRPSREEVRRLILLLTEWRPLMPAEIAHYLGRKSVKRLVADYVSPMFEEGLLDRTIPDKPSHPGQRYSISKKGRVELM